MYSSSPSKAVLLIAGIAALLFAASLAKHHEPHHSGRVYYAPNLSDPIPSYPRPEQLHCLQTVKFPEGATLLHWLAPNPGTASSCLGHRSLSLPRAVVAAT